MIQVEQNFRSVALNARQEALEVVLVERLVLHSKRMTIEPKEMQTKTKRDFERSRINCVPRTVFSQ
jgi:hypothetical protein